jgi:hypothetical protein
MKKKLDTIQITNELKGQSLHFEAQSKRLAKIGAQKDANARTSERANARTDERVNTRTAERANIRTSEHKNVPRIITRHSYQFYIDQVEDMKNLWRSYQARGIEVDLAHFAREAFDEYLTRIKEKANESTNARTRERANAKKHDLTGENESAKL